MKTNLIILLLAAILSLGIISCTKEEDKVSNVKKIENTAIIKDDLGHDVIIPENPQRILALNSASMEALFNLGITPIGKIENYKIRPEGIALPSVGLPSAINIEAVCSLKPDLILAHSRFHSAIISELEQSGAAVYCFNPEKIDATLTMYIARLIGKEDAAKAYDEAYIALCRSLAKKVHEAKDFKTGIIVQEGDTVKAAQSASGFGALLTNLEIKNIVPDGLPDSSNASFVSFDMEAITAENPDIIFIIPASGDGQGKGKGQGAGKGKGKKKGNNEESTLKKYMKNPAWSSLDAAKNGTLIVLPASVNPNRSTQSDMIQTTADCILKALKNKQ